MVSVGSNFFHNVTLPCTLWFFDNGKPRTDRADKTLFLDVREIYKQVDRAHREFTEAHVERIANIVKLYRGDQDSLEFNHTKKKDLEAEFPNLEYRDIAGLCKVVDKEAIEKQDWSLNAGRYVDVAEAEEEDYIFEERLKELNDELLGLNSNAHDLESKISHNGKKLLGV